MSEKIDRTGEVKTMNNGYTYKIIEYKNYKDITVEILEFRHIIKTTYGQFKKGNIRYIPNRVGEKRIMNCGEEAEIVKYNNSYDVTVKFTKTGETVRTKYVNFKTGKVKSVFTPTVYGVGIIGTRKSDVTKSIFYKVWIAMLERCYSEKCINENISYKGCTVCNEWLFYPTFKKWCDENYYEVEGERMQLDKDILNHGNKIYSPDSCIFVPWRINKLFVKQPKVYRFDLPIGVNYFKRDNVYQVRLRKNGTTKYLGRYSTPEEAFYVYKEAKENYIKEVADEYKDKIPNKLYEAMYKYEVYLDD